MRAALVPTAATAAPRPTAIATRRPQPARRPALATSLAPAAPAGAHTTEALHSNTPLASLQPQPTAAGKYSAGIDSLMAQFRAQTAPFVPPRSPREAAAVTPPAPATIAACRELRSVTREAGAVNSIVLAAQLSTAVWAALQRSGRAPPTRTRRAAVAP